MQRAARLGLNSQHGGKTVGDLGALYIAEEEFEPQNDSVTADSVARLNKSLTDSDRLRASRDQGELVRESELQVWKQRAGWTMWTVAVATALTEHHEHYFGKARGPKPVRTHLRNMIIVPEMIGSTVGIYNSKTFNQTTVYFQHSIILHINSTLIPRRNQGRVDFT
uniref:Uncharacterized protein n=1 Tax=Oryza punctata TaxID=4537 RepID=A0A0E0LHX1_ORYPU